MVGIFENLTFRVYIDVLLKIICYNKINRTKKWQTKLIKKRENINNFMKIS